MKGGQTFEYLLLQKRRDYYLAEEWRHHVAVGETRRLNKGKSENHFNMAAHCRNKANKIEKLLHRT